MATWQSRFWALRLLDERSLSLLDLLLADYMSQTEAFLKPREYLNTDVVIEASSTNNLDYFSKFFANIQRSAIGDSKKLFVFKASWAQIAMLQR